MLNINRLMATGTRTLFRGCSLAPTGMRSSFNPQSHLITAPLSKAPLTGQRYITTSTTPTMKERQSKLEKSFHKLFKQGNIVNALDQITRMKPGATKDQFIIDNLEMVFEEANCKKDVFDKIEITRVVQLLLQMQPGDAKNEKIMLYVSKLAKEGCDASDLLRHLSGAEAAKLNVDLQLDIYFRKGEYSNCISLAEMANSKPLFQKFINKVIDEGQTSPDSIHVEGEEGTKLKKLPQSKPIGRSSIEDINTYIYDVSDKKESKSILSSKPLYSQIREVLDRIEEGPEKQAILKETVAKLSAKGETFYANYLHNMYSEEAKLKREEDAKLVNQVQAKASSFFSNWFKF